MALLDTIGMLWKKPDPWQHRYELAQGYLQGHGNLAVLMGIRPETAASRQGGKIE